MRLFLMLVVAPAVVCGQRPVISSVVNAATYTTGGYTGKGLSGGSLVSVFGSNLAATEQGASGFPLPTTLGGTSVTLNGLPVPLLYVSPRQINIQLSGVPVTPPPNDRYDLVVFTPAGASEPFSVPAEYGPFGIFTLDGSGCGRGAVFNVGSDGRLSLNSPSNSVSPGDYITVFGTGLVGFFNAPPPGSPAPSDPPSLAMDWSVLSGIFDLPPTRGFGLLRPRVSWAGRAPGFAGLDQVNVRVPDTVREGCGVPLMIGANGGQSQPIPISIRKGGGVCLDPPSSGYGLITWERTESGQSGSLTETFTAVFPASPGKQQPPAQEYQQGPTFNVIDLFGPACPLPGYTNLDAGRMFIEGSGFGPVEAPLAVVDGERVYRAVLPPGTIRAGSFRVTASGGGDIGSFQSPLRIGAGINITSSFPPGTVVRLAASGGLRELAVNWTGGNPDTWVTVKLVGHHGKADVYNFTQARTSIGTARVSTQLLSPGRGEIILEVTPDPADVPALSPPGLSLGGQHLWKYTYRFGGLTLQ